MITRDGADTGCKQHQQEDVLLMSENGHRGSLGSRGSFRVDSLHVLGWRLGVVSEMPVVPVSRLLQASAGRSSCVCTHDDLVTNQ